MKKLILIRHAKSSWSSGASDDKSRPINDRGREAATNVGNWLAKNGLSPDQVISSSATRCAETWAGIAAALPDGPAPEFKDTLYMATDDQMLSILQSATGDTVALVAHNPGTAEFSRSLRRDPPPHHASFDKYPSGAVTVFEFKADSWEEVLMGTGKFIDYVEPRSLS